MPIEANLNERICEEQFEYGNHIVNVSIDIVAEDFDPYAEGVSYLNYDVSKYDCFRKVRVSAHEKGDKPRSFDEADIYVEQYAALGASQETYEKTVGLLGLQTKTVTKGERQIPVREHVKKTVEPVLSKIDTFYKFSRQDVDVEIEVAMEELNAHTSWVDVEDKTNEITSELDSLVE